MLRKLLYLTPVIIFSVMLIMAACSEQDIVQTPVMEQEIVEKNIEILVQEHENKVTIERGDDQVEISYDPVLQTLRYHHEDYTMEFFPGGFREFTSYDRLTVSIAFLDPDLPTRIETYVLNGQVLELLIVGEEPTVEQISQFHEFYEADPQLNSLENCHDGQAMLEIVEQAEPQILQIWKERDPESYQQFMQSLDEDRQMLYRPNWADVSCNIAIACIATKCWFGGLANTACAACTIYVAACAIMDAFSWW
jgi:hypothetical protein